MKKIYLTCIAALAFTWELSVQAAGRDGTWWKSLDATQQVFYVVGLLDGVPVGGVVGSMNCYDENDQLIDSSDSCVADVTSGFFTAYNRIGFAKREPKSILSGLDSFYTDFRNLNIPVADALSQVIRGMNGANVEGAIENLRRVY